MTVAKLAKEGIGAQIKVWLIRFDEYFDRPGIYGPPNGAYDDNLERFSFFTWAALHFAMRDYFEPDIIHMHDWQTSMLPAQLRKLATTTDYFKRTKTVLTIHNLAFQGVSPLPQLKQMPYMPSDLLKDGTYEIWGQANPLKGAILTADAVTTVSPTYAHEITTEEMGSGLLGQSKQKSEAPGDVCC